MANAEGAASQAASNNQSESSSWAQQNRPTESTSSSYAHSGVNSSSNASSSQLALHSVRQYSTPAPLIAGRPSTAPLGTPSGTQKVLDLDGSSEKQQHHQSVIDSSSSSKSPYLNVNCDIYSSSSSKSTNETSSVGRKWVFYFLNVWFSTSLVWPFLHDIVWVYFAFCLCSVYFFLNIFLNAFFIFFSSFIYLLQCCSKRSDVLLRRRFVDLFNLFFCCSTFACFSAISWFFSKCTNFIFYFAGHYLRLSTRNSLKGLFFWSI